MLCITLACFAIMAVASLISSTALTQVSYTVGNKELPIYCVDTQEKKIALSFDAAWVNGKLR